MKEENEDKECICSGNWRLIIKECEDLFHKEFVYDYGDGDNVWILYGIVHTNEDYYYGMINKNSKKTSLLSCVGSLDTHGYYLKK